MTTEITPSAGLFSGFADKENGWGAQVNANWLTLELLSVPIVTSAVVSNPPASPNSGDRYIIPANATGSWLGKDNQIALYMRGTWFYFPAKKGWLFHSLNESKTYQFSGAVWSQFFESLSSDTMQKINAAIAAGVSAELDAQATAADRAVVLLAKSETLTARDIAATSATNALASKNAAQVARDQAVAAKTDAQTARDGAAASEQIASYAAQSLQNSASSSAVNAATAQAAATSAVNAWNSLDDRYLGPKATAPTTDNGGDPLLPGALYLNTTDGLLYVFSNGVWSKTTPNSAINVQKSVATAGQTVFSTPQFTTGTNTVLVFLNGVLKPITEASDGKSVTLATAATGGENVVIHVIQTLAFGSTEANLVTASDGASGSLFTSVAGFITRLMSSAGASLIGFIQAGVGTITRSIQDKLRETVSVIDFGADPTGNTDSTAAIQRALDSETNLYFPSGTYKVSSTLIATLFGYSLRSSMGMFGGAYINYTGTGPCMLFTASTAYNTLQGIHIKQVPAIPTDFYNTGSVGIETVGCNVHMYNCRVTGFEILIKSHNDSYYNKFIRCRFDHARIVLDNFSINNIEVIGCRVQEFNQFLLCFGNNGVANIVNNSFEIFNGNIVYSHDTGHVQFSGNYVEIYWNTAAPTNFPVNTFGMFTDAIFFGGNYGRLRVEDNNFQMNGARRIVSAGTINSLRCAGNTITDFVAGSFVDQLYSVVNPMRDCYIRDTLNVLYDTNTVIVTGRTRGQSYLPIADPSFPFEYYDAIQGQSYPAASIVGSYPNIHVPTLLGGWANASSSNPVRVRYTKDGIYLHGIVNGSAAGSNITIFSLPTPYMAKCSSSDITFHWAVTYNNNMNPPMEAVTFRYLYANGDFRLESSPTSKANIVLDGIFIPHL